MTAAREWLAKKGSGAVAGPGLPAAETGGGQTAEAVGEELWSSCGGLGLEDYHSLQEPAGVFSADLGHCWLATRELPPPLSPTTAVQGGAVAVAVQAGTRRCILKVLRLADGAAVAGLARLLAKLRAVEQAQTSPQSRQAVWAPVAVFRRFPTATDKHEALLASLTGVAAEDAVCDGYLELPHLRFGDDLTTLPLKVAAGSVGEDGATGGWALDDCLGFFQGWLHALAVLHSAGLAPAAAICPGGGVLVARQPGALGGGERSRPFVVGAVCGGLDLAGDRRGGLRAPGGVPAAAPEVSSGGTPGTAADMYCVGWWFYRALIGREPFPGRAGPAFPADLPPRMRPAAELVGLLLATDPATRPPALSAAGHSCFSAAAAVAALATERKVVELGLKQQVLAAHIGSLKRDAGRRGGTSITVQRRRLCDSVVEQFLQAPGWDSQTRAGRGAYDDAPPPPRPGLYGRLRCQFEGEQGIDAGGLSKEMFTLFFDQLFDLAHCTLFQSAAPPEAGQSGPYLPQPLDPEGLHPEASLAFEGVGRVIAKALVDDIPVALPLAPSAYRYLLHGEDRDRPTIHDYAAFDPESARSCLQILEVEDSSCLCLSFEDVGRPSDDAEVTNENRQDYVDTKITWELEGCRIAELRALRRGFTQATAELAAHLALFSPPELMVLLRANGLPDLNPDEFLQNTDFTGFPAASRTPHHFKAAIRALPAVALRRLLRFITAQNSLPRPPPPGQPPANAAVDNGGDGGRIKIACQRGMSTTSLPVGHTCFNRLDFPDYNTAELVEARLQFCIENLENASFGES